MPGESGMPVRTRSHRLEDQPRDRVRTIFSDKGWTVEDVRKDYGEDLIVRTFLKDTPTPYWFFGERYPAEMRERASSVGATMRAEDGLAKAVNRVHALPAH